MTKETMEKLVNGWRKVINIGIEMNKVIKPSKDAALVEALYNQTVVIMEFNTILSEALLKEVEK